MNTRRLIVPSLLAFAAFTGTSYAALLKVGVSFVGRGNDQTLGVDETAGVDPQADWNNLGNNRAGEPTGNFSDPQFNNLTSSALFSDDGAAGTRGTSGITLSLTANDSWNSDGPTGSTNERLMKGIVKAQNNFTATVTLHGLDITKNYKFIAYTAENGAGANGDYGLSGSSVYSSYFAQITNSFDGTFTRGTSTDINNRTTGVDYVQWDSVSAQANGDLVFTMHHNSGTDGIGLAGIQLVELPPAVGPDKFWNFGAGVGNWDTGVTQNWRSVNTAGASDATFANQDRANFGNLGLTGTRTVNVDVNGVSPGDMVVNNAAGNDYIIQGGAIKGFGGFTKTGNGALTLSGANEFAGVVNIQHGTVNVSTIGDASAAGNLGKGTLIVLGDTTGASDAVLNFTGTSLTAVRSVNVASTGGTVNVPASQTLTLSDITGGGGITKAGNGALSFTGTASTFSGSVTVTGGSLTVRTIGSGTGLISLNAGTSFNVAAPLTTTDNRVLFLNGNASVGVTATNGNYALTSDFNDGGKVLTKTGNGRLELAGAASFSVLPVISAGTLALTKETTTGGVTTPNVTLPSGGINLGANQRLEIVPGVLGASNPITLSGGSLRVGHQGLQTYLFTGGFDNGQFTDNMNGSPYTVANYFAAAGSPALTTRSNANGVTNLTFGSFSGAAPFANLGVNDGDNVRAIFYGKIRIDSAGDTTFFTSSDDGSGLFIDGVRVVLNNNFQGNTTRQGTINLTAGLHDFLMYYAEGGGDAGLIAEYTPAGGSRQVIPNSVLTTADVESFTAPTITVTAPSTIESGAALAQFGTLALPANTLLTVNGSASFNATALTGGAHQVAVTGFNANTSLGVLSGATALTKTGNGNLVFAIAPPAGTTIASNDGLVVAMGSNAGGNPLATTLLTFNGGGFGMSSTGGDVMYSNAVSSTSNLTIAAGSFGNGNITAATNITFNPAGLVAPTGNTLTLRVNDGNFTLNVTPQITGTGAIITDEGKLNLNGGVNNVGGNFTNRAGTVNINGNLATSGLTQLGNQPNGSTGANLGDNLIAGQFLPGSLTVTGTTNATSITTTRGTLNLNGNVTNTGVLTLNGNGTMNLAASTHASASVTGNGTLNANGTFQTSGAFTATAGTTNFNQAATVPGGVTLSGSALVNVKTSLNAGASGVSASTGTSINFDPGTGNTSTYTGGNIVLNSSAAVVAKSGITDLGNASINASSPLIVTSLVAGNPANSLFAAKANNDIGIRALNGAGAQQAINAPTIATTSLPNGSGASNNGGIDFPQNGDPTFNQFFGTGGGSTDFSAYIYGTFTAKVSGTHNFRKTNGDDWNMVIADTNYNGVFDNGDTWSADACCSQDTSININLTAGQRIMVAWMVDDSGGDSGLRGYFNEPGGGTITGSTIVSPGTQSGYWSAEKSNGGGGTVAVSANAELRTKSVSNVTSLAIDNNATLTLSNQGSATASNADRIKLTSSAGTVRVGDNQVLSVGELALGSAGTLNIDTPAGATTGGRIVVTGSVTGATNVASNIQGSIINVNGGGLIANVPINGVGMVNASGTGLVGGTASINMPINVFGSASIAPGDPASNGGIGKLVTGPLTSNSGGGNFAVQLKNKNVGNYDQLSVFGFVDITNTNLALALDPAFAASPGDQFPILLNDDTGGSSDPIFGQFAQGTSITVGINQFQIHYDGNFDAGLQGNDVYLQYVVPEPGTVAIMLGGFATLIGLGRARRRR